jgi:phosphoglycolate phosphatase-like HAD superfamily hydrolase
MSSKRKKPVWQDYTHDDPPWVHGSHCEWINAIDALTRIKNKIASLGIKTHKDFAVVFDLDSTIFCVDARSRSIFASFLREHSGAPQLWHRVHAAWKRVHHSYSIRETIENVLREIGEGSQSLKLSFKIWQEFEDYWLQHFFSSRFMIHDEIYLGAKEFLEEIHKLEVKIIYLTGRDTISSALGTRESLKRFGLPYYEGQLILKPGPRGNLGDLEFKTKAAEILSHQYEVLMAIDNEPENLIPMAKYFHKADIIWMLTVMSKKIPTEKIEDQLAARKLYLLKTFQIHD